MKQYVYPSIFTPEADGRYSVLFPDLHGCYTCGNDLADAIFMAQDVLAFTLFDLESHGCRIPEPSAKEAIELKDGEFVNYIVCDTLEYSKMHSKKAVKKTLTIPEWLNNEAEKQNINFSGVLQDALQKKLGIA